MRTGEEAGVVPRSAYRYAQQRESFDIVADDTLWHSVAFLALIDRQMELRLNDEHDGFRWIAQERIDAETLWASERNVLADLIRDILQDGSVKPFLRIKLD